MQRPDAFPFVACHMPGVMSGATMEVILWGVRGSIPNPCPANRFYGSNTTCLEVRPSPELLCIFDAGTGIRSLGKILPEHGECHIFISHGHSDHVQGLSFFQPFFEPHWIINLYIPHWLPNLPYQLFDGSSFPVSFAELKAAVHIHTVREGTPTVLESRAGPVRVEAVTGNHPGGSVAYRIISRDAAFLFSGDHEITRDDAVRERTGAMLRGMDMAVVDAAYSRESYRKGWGHSAWEDWFDAAAQCGVKTLVLSHHMEDAEDTELDALQKNVRRRLEETPGSRMRVVAAREEMRLELHDEAEIDCKSSNWLQTFFDSLSQCKEESTLLDRILYATREIANADAGSIYLVDDDELVFAYSHNDTLFPTDNRNKSMYVNMRLPITTDSIAGFAASTGTVLNLPDVHSLPDGVPFKFNSSFDEKTGYYSESMLTIPILSHTGDLLGVLQLINSLDPRTRSPRPFSDFIAASVQSVARDAASFLEISAGVYESVYRLLRIAMLHDPSETGPHAERVGAIAAEVYHHWAYKNGEAPEIIREFKGRLRLAAMLHDIGKVGISDLILKKPGKLTREEFDVMRSHTVLGSELFSAESRDITELAHEITLHHHQKWDGTGYPEMNGGTLAGEAIPLAARFTAIADVFDALVSPRCYKDAWPFERAAELIRQQAGKHFDPDLALCFSEILETVRMIYTRYPDVHE